MDPFSFTIAAVAQLGIGYLFPSEGPRLKDLKISASTYGAAIPWTFGTTRVPGNMIWSQKIKEHKKRKLVGKGGFTNQYTYSCSFAMGLCQGPISQVRRIWANGKVILDITGNSQIAVYKGLRIRTYLGGEEQLPDSLIETDKGVGNAPAFRGLCYLVFDNMPLADFGNQIPQITVEVFRDGVGVGSAPYVTMTENDGSSLTGYDKNTLIVDSNRGYIYLTEPGVGLMRVSMNAGVQNMTITNRQMAFPDTTFYGSLGGAKRDSQTLSALLAVSPSTGNLMVQHGFNNDVAIDILDANSYAAIATSGSSDPFGYAGFGGPYEPVAPGSMNTAISTTTAGLEYVGWRSLFGGIFTVPFDPANLHGGQVGQAGSVYLPGAIVGSDGLDNPEFYTCTEAADSMSLVLSGPAGGAIIESPDPQSTVAIRQVLWDSADPGVVLLFVTSNAGWAAKWSRTSNTVTWIKQVPPGFIPIYGHAANIQFHELAVLVGEAHSIYILDTITGDWATHTSPRAIDAVDEKPSDILPTNQNNYTGIPVASDTANDNQFYDSERNVIVTIGEGAARILRVGQGNEDTTLGLIVETMLRYGGMASEQFDMSRLYSTPVKGYGWARSTDVKSILDELRRLYLFDIVESDGKLVGVLRGAGSDAVNPGQAVDTIPQNVLGSSSQDVMDCWQETRIQEVDLPERITLAYMNINDDFLKSVATSNRISAPIPTMYSRQQVALEVSVVMTPTEAKNQTNKALYAQWSERTKHSTRLPWAYLHLDPADLISVEMNDGRGYFDRIHVNEIGADYAIAIEAYSQDAGAYESDVVADGGGAGVPNTIPLPLPAKAFVLNTPLLRDADDTGGSFSAYYAGTGNAAPGRFGGAAMFVAKNGIDYLDLFATDSDVTWGSVAAITAPPRHGNYALDWETKIIIWPAEDGFELEPITDDELWAGGNACMVGDEVIQFRDCVENADGSWTIWNLLRGRRGTDYACGSHKSGEFFVLLSGSAILKQGDVVDARGQTRFFKAVGEGLTLAGAAPLQVVYEPRDLMPYAPKDIRRSISGGAITVTWARRTRMGGNMQDYTGTVPLHETTEQYEIYFLDAPFSGDLSRGNAANSWIFMATTTTPSYTWTPGSPSGFDVNLDTLHVVIYQVSAAVGRGFPGVRSIEPWQDF